MKDKKVLSGKEPFLINNELQEKTVKDFWAWSLSRLLMDGPRGDLAEYIVRMALDEDVETPKRGFGECDIVYRDCRIEVKCSSLLQEWERKKLSRPVFSIAKTVNCDIAERDGKYYYVGRDGSEAKRRSDVYVFCLFANINRETANPLDMNQWKFWIASTAKINEVFGDRRSISLGSFKKIDAIECEYCGIKDAVNATYLPCEQKS